VVANHKIGVQLSLPAQKGKIMGIKLKEEDLEYVAKIHNVLTKAMSDMPRELMNSDRFGAWAVTAVVNILCRLLKIMNCDKEKAHALINDIWDHQEDVYKVLN
jgi:hypothetical protein